MPAPQPKLTPDQKLRIASCLYATARKVKLAALRCKHPHLSEAELEKMVNLRLFLMHD